MWEYLDKGTRMIRQAMYDTHRGCGCNLGWTEACVGQSELLPIAQDVRSSECVVGTAELAQELMLVTQDVLDLFDLRLAIYHDGHWFVIINHKLIRSFVECV